MNMKKIYLIALALACLTFSSCQKIAQDLLIGKWEVTVVSRYQVTFGETTNTSEDTSVWFYTFEDESNGYLVNESGTRSQEFTYRHNVAGKTLTFNFSGVETELKIKSLTPTRFVLLGSSGVSIGSLASGSAELTYTGKKVSSHTD